MFDPLIFELNRLTVFIEFRIKINLQVSECRNLVQKNNKLLSKSHRNQRSGAGHRSERMNDVLTPFILNAFQTKMLDRFEPTVSTEKYTYRNKVFLGNTFLETNYFKT